MEFERGETFLQAASQQPFAVVFLDIFMGGTNGVEIAKQLREFDKDCMIAFSATSTDYALEGFRVRATQYLVKPFTQKDMDDLLGEILPRLPKLDDSVSLRVNGGDAQLCLKDMVYAEHFSHLIHVVTSFGRTLVTRQSLAAFMEPLKEDSLFLMQPEGKRRGHSVGAAHCPEKRRRKHICLRWQHFHGQGHAARRRPCSSPLKALPPIIQVFTELVNSVIIIHTMLIKVRDLR